MAAHQSSAHHVEGGSESFVAHCRLAAMAWLVQAGLRCTLPTPRPIEVPSHLPVTTVARPSAELRAWRQGSAAPGRATSSTKRRPFCSLMSLPSRRWRGVRRVSQLPRSCPLVRPLFVPTTAHALTLQECLAHDSDDAGVDAQETCFRSAMSRGRQAGTQGRTSTSCLTRTRESSKCGTTSAVS